MGKEERYMPSRFGLGYGNGMSTNSIFEIVIIWK